MNATAPNPVTKAEFIRMLPSTLHRPAIAVVPEFALKLMFGDTASVLLDSQRVLPKAALAAGFQFCHRDLGAARADLVGYARKPNIPATFR